MMGKADDMEDRSRSGWNSKEGDSAGRMERLRLMLIVPMLHQGGFERVCVETARLLEPYFEVCIVLFDSRDIAYDITGLRVIDLHLGVRESIPGKLLNVWKRSLAVRRLKRRLSIDIAYSFGPTANMVNVFSGRRAEIWTGIRSYMDMGSPRKIRLFSGMSDRVLCCSRRIEEEVREKYGCKRAVALCNPLNVEALRSRAGAEEPRLPWQDRGRIIVSMGREDDVKGFWHLIKSFSLVQKEVSDARLMIIGEGDFEEYKELAKGLGVEEQVYFTGLQRNPFPYLEAARLYVLTSYNEGFPNALIEAMALGVPVAATDCMTGPREILMKEYSSSEGTAETLWGDYGILLPNMSPEKNLDPGDITQEEERLAEVMKRMLTETELWQGYERAALERSRDFSEERYVDTIRQLAGERQGCLHSQGGCDKMGKIQRN